jgi:hypothetical protein
MWTVANEQREGLGPAKVSSPLVSENPWSADRARMHLIMIVREVRQSQ